MDESKDNVRSHTTYCLAQGGACVCDYYVGAPVDEATRAGEAVKARADSMTKREAFAMRIAAGLSANSSRHDEARTITEEMKFAVRRADALIAALNASGETS